MKGKAGVVKDTVRYSEAFKLQVLRELEEGRWEGRSAAARAYGLSGHATIAYWARQYGKEHLMGKVIRVEQAKELNEGRELRKRVRELEKALADAHLEHRFDEAYLRIACQAAGIEDVGEFKKTRWEAVNGVVEGGAKEAGIRVGELCAHVGMSRQNYYAARRLRRRREVDEELIVGLARRERQMQPRLGARKLMH